MRLPDPRRVSPERDNDVGFLAILLGGWLTCLGVLEILRAASSLRFALGFAWAPLGLLILAWGRTSWRTWKGAVADQRAAIAEADLLPEGAEIERLAEALNGRALAALAAPEENTYRGSQQIRPEREARVAFVRDAVPQVAYSRYMPKSSWASPDLAGPGVYATRRYWRVRAEVQTEVVFFIAARSGLDALLRSAGFKFDANLGDEAFDDAFDVVGTLTGWLRANLGEEARAILLRRPAFVVRCHRGGVEVLWDARFAPSTISRFDDASKIVTSLTRALSGMPSAAFR